MDEQEKNKLLQESGKRSLTLEEQEKLNNWYASFDVSSKNIKVFRDSEHEETVRTRLLDKIIVQIVEKKHSSYLRVVFNKPYNWLKVASVIAFFMIGIPIYNYVKTTNNPEVAETPILHSNKALMGKILKIRLSDGSEIWLNSGSEIKYPTQFSEKKREVYLKGEAFFKIAPNSAKPFVVNTGKLETVVLGTSFNIKAYPNIEHINIAVATGKVSIVASGKTLSLLNPDQQISIHTETGEFEVTDVNSKLATSWQEGKIRLDGASFKELSLTIKNTWGYRLETESNRLVAANFKTTFNANNKIEEVMKTISKMTDAKYRIRDTIITLYE